jgi:hypothetical protein
MLLTSHDDARTTIPLVSMYTLDFNNPAHRHTTEDSLAICVEYYKRMAPLQLWPEVRVYDEALIPTFVETLLAAVVGGGECFSVVLVEETTGTTLFSTGNDDDDDDIIRSTRTGVVITKDVEDIAVVGEACAEFGSSGKYNNNIVLCKPQTCQRRKNPLSSSVVRIAEGIILVLLIMAGGAHLLASYNCPAYGRLV